MCKSDEEKKVSIELPYLDIENVHILETALDILFKKAGVRKLSDIFSS